MKKFEAPEVEINRFQLEDVITTSGSGEIVTPTTPTAPGDMTDKA